QSLIFDAQRQIALDRPYEVLYYATNIEGYRQDRFVNWTVSAGTIWHEWSLLGLRPPGLRGGPHLSARFDSAIRGGESMLVNAEVSTTDGAPVESATVEFSVSHGNLTLGGSTGPTVAGRTDARGRVSAVFDAPSFSSQTTVLVRLNASHPRYQESTVLTGSIQVFPPAVRFLSITLELPLGDLGNPGVTLPLRVTVRDQDRNFPADAFVELNSSDPALLRTNPTNGTASDVGSVLLVVDDEARDESTVRVTVRATRPGSADAEQGVFVSIRPPPLTLECPGEEFVADLANCPEVGASWGPVVALSLAGIGLGVAISLVWRRLRRV
ncbi:MAG TPA: hypothetical protein VJ400_03575, partial [Thermoplasmata archaeon]|nr:hypothetical protein [Thermoplasmata archaeon]